MGWGLERFRMVQPAGVGTMCLGPRARRGPPVPRTRGSICQWDRGSRRLLGVGATGLLWRLKVGLPVVVAGVAAMRQPPCTPSVAPAAGTASELLEPGPTGCLNDFRRSYGIPSPMVHDPSAPTTPRTARPEILPLPIGYETLLSPNTWYPSSTQYTPLGILGTLCEHCGYPYWGNATAEDSESMPEEAGSASTDWIWALAPQQ